MRTSSDRLWCSSFPLKRLLSQTLTCHLSTCLSRQDHLHLVVPRALLAFSGALNDVDAISGRDLQAVGAVELALWRTHDVLGVKIKEVDRAFRSLVVAPVRFEVVQTSRLP